MPWHGVCSAYAKMPNRPNKPARVKPSVRSTETYTESNFLRLYTAASPSGGQVRVVTLEHLRYTADDPARAGWRCQTIVDGEPMSNEDALFIAHSYAAAHDVPVIYASHAE